MSKVEITGASAFVNRMFEACGPYQWAREFLANSLEADATRIEFGIEWQAVEKHGIYRRTIIDNGKGMGRDELFRFFSTLGEGGKKIGGVHDNFGVGAKIASLPWNPEGVIVISYKAGKASMIHIVLEPQSGDYELIDFELDDRKSAVIDPAEVDWQALNDVDYSALRPEWVTDSGTIIVLLGSDSHPDTILGNPNDGIEGTTKGLSVYLNSRFWDLSGQEVRVVETRSEKKNQWPTSASDQDDSRRPNNRRILGAKYYLSDLKSTDGKLKASGSVPLDEGRVSAGWYLWEGKRPQVHTYAKEGGYVAARYKDELYSLSSGKVQFRGFGVVESKVQQNLTIILEPQHFDGQSGRWGVHPDQSRTRLIFTGDGEKGAELPFHDWGAEFARNMPPEIEEAILNARGETTGSIDDDEYRKRLQDKFGNRWMTRQLVMATPKNDKDPTKPANKDGLTLEAITEEPATGRGGQRSKRSKAIRKLVAKAFTGADGIGIEREVVVDVPRYRWGNKEDFEQPWHIALWNEAENTVVLNPEAPVVLESIKYHQDQYPPIHAEQIPKIVMGVFGEVAVSKIAHSQKLRKLVSDEELRNEYRNEKSLTIALMGLLAEESLISQRLGRLGRKVAA